MIHGFLCAGCNSNSFTNLCSSCMIVLQGLVSLNYTKTEMSSARAVATFEDGDGVGAGVGAGSTEGRSEKEIVRRRKDILLEEKLLLSKVASVEVMWNGHIEYVSFPLPTAVKYLSQETRQTFLDEVDLSTNETRMKELLKNATIFSAEMQAVRLENGVAIVDISYLE